jgi:hypothetical protein
MQHTLTQTENEMELETVKIISRNKAIRGLEFDVYYYGEGSSLELVSIEEVEGTQNLKGTFSEASLADVKLSLNEVLTGRKIRKLAASFSQDLTNAGYEDDYLDNQKRGWSNE